MIQDILDHKWYVITGVAVPVTDDVAYRKMNNFVTDAPDGIWNGSMFGEPRMEKRFMGETQWVTTPSIPHLFGYSVRQFLPFIS